MRLSEHHHITCSGGEKRDCRDCYTTELSAPVPDHTTISSLSQTDWNSQQAWWISHVNTFLLNCFRNVTKSGHLWLPNASESETICSHVNTTIDFRHSNYFLTMVSLLIFRHSSFFIFKKNKISNSLGTF